MSKEWKFASSVILTKKDLLALSVLAGEGSIQNYLERLIRNHIDAKQSVVATTTCAKHAFCYPDGEKPYFTCGCEIPVNR